jgi:hypothetical protein
MRKVCPVLLAVLVAGVVLPATGLAQTRKQAAAVALAALKPGKGAAVYGLPGKLPAGSTVSDAGPSGPFTVEQLDKGKGVRLSAKIPVTKLAAPGWLFWDDLKAGANFPHASTLVLVDDRTGKVAWTKTLNWWPLVDGKEAAFFRHSDQAAYRVTSAAGSAAAFKGDCVITLVDRGDDRPIANFSGDAKAMLGLASSYGMPSASAGSMDELRQALNDLVDKGKCKDVVLFVGGHGTPESGPGATEEPTVILSWHKVAVGNNEVAVVDEAVTATNLVDLVDEYRAKAKFKILINSCFAGRFVDDLAHQPAVAMIATASQGNEVSYQALAGDTATEHPDEAGTWVTGLTKEYRKILDGNEPNVDAHDAREAKSDLVFALTLAADHVGDTDAAAGQGLTHPSAIAYASATGIPPEPKVTPIKAVFTPSLVPGCKPPACTTVYTELAKGTHLQYSWKLKIRADPGCAKGFAAGSPKPNEATWFHADESEGGPCNHAGTRYYAATFGHPGTVTVVVTDKYWSCTAKFHGTQSATGQPVAEGPEPKCTQTKH